MVYRISSLAYCIWRYSISAALSGVMNPFFVWSDGLNFVWSKAIFRCFAYDGLGQGVVMGFELPVIWMSTWAT